VPHTGRLIFSLTLAGWILLEIGVRIWESVQGRGRTGRDHATRVAIGVSIGVSIAAAVSASHGHSLRIPAAGRWAGLAVMWSGLAVRAWAIVTLGKSFRTTVEVDPDQTVISTGPYALIRHPSYTGLLLIVLGVGLALGDWVSLIICALVPLPALLLRIRVEEAELVRVLGESYVDYEERTKRLIPGVW
jgi:protein-S-isoprenylcysteine O-methyltransferase Ste14